MKIVLTREDLKQERRHFDINDVDLEDFHDYLNLIRVMVLADIVTFEDERTGMTRDIKNRWNREDFKYFKTKIEGYGSTEFTFTCYPNTEPIEIGDTYIVFVFGKADVQVCDSESIKKEVNGFIAESRDPMDLMSTFWQNCYLIKQTDFQVEKLIEE